MSINCSNNNCSSNNKHKQKDTLLWSIMIHVSSALTLTITIEIIIMMMMMMMMMLMMMMRKIMTMMRTTMTTNHKLIMSWCGSITWKEVLIKGPTAYLWPSGHKIQYRAPVVLLYVPLAHSSGASIPTLGHWKPAGHTLQSLRLSASE